MTDAELKPTQICVPLFQGDDMRRVQEAFEAIEDAKRRYATLATVAKTATGNRLGDGDGLEEARLEVLRLAAEYDDLVNDAKTRAVAVVVEHLGRKQWRTLTVECPPREGVKGDENLGFDEEKMGDLLLMHEGTIVEPAFPSVAAKQAWLDKRSDAQFELLFNAAYTVNRGSLPDPKANMLSTLTQIFDATLSSASDSAER